MFQAYDVARPCLNVFGTFAVLQADDGGSRDRAGVLKHIPMRTTKEHL